MLKKSENTLQKLSYGNEKSLFLNVIVFDLSYFRQSEQHVSDNVGLFVR